MIKFKYVIYALLAIGLMALLVAAQAPAEVKELTKEQLKSLGDQNAVNTTVLAYKAIGGGIGFGLAAGLAGIGQGLVGSRAAEGAARNPGAAGTVQTMMIIALALIESLVLFALLIVFVKL
ncbi:MAG: ATP synthase F0 subunit C [Acidobacteriota bacterium]